MQSEIVEALPDAQVERIAGASRYGTSLELARAAVAEGADASRTWLATGRNWPDALAAGPAAAPNQGLLLLVGARLAGSPGVPTWVQEHAGSTDRLHLVGGSNAVTPGQESRAYWRLTSSEHAPSPQGRPSKRRVIPPVCRMRNATHSADGRSISRSSSTPSSVTRYRTKGPRTIVPSR